MVYVVSVYEEGLLRAFEDQGVGFGSKVAREVMDQAILLAPGATGELKRSHRVVQGRGGRGRFSAEFHVENYSPHALYVHNGTGVYGPRGVPIVPINTEKRMFMHVPANRGFRWKLTTRHGVPVYDPGDPFGHLKSERGQPGNPWLQQAGQLVAYLHGAF